MHYYQLDHISQQWGLWFEDEETLKKPFYRVYGHFGEQNNCPYCCSVLQIYRGENYKESESEYLKLCPKCGWWRSLRRYWHEGDELETLPVLSKVYSPDEELPIRELRKELLKNWGLRKEITPGQCEKLISEIFSEVLECKVNYLTSSVYSPDKGIDFVLINDNKGISYAFQVKRRQTDKPECVRPVREFIGSVAQSQYAKAYFVTTANDFTRNVWTEHNDSYETLKAKGIELSLVDGKNLYRILKDTKLLTQNEKTLVDKINIISSYSDELFRVYNTGEAYETKITRDDFKQAVERIIL